MSGWVDRPRSEGMPPSWRRVTSPALLTLAAEAVDGSRRSASLSVLRPEDSALAVTRLMTQQLEEVVGRSVAAEVWSVIRSVFPAFDRARLFSRTPEDSSTAIWEFDCFFLAPASGEAVRFACAASSGFSSASASFRVRPTAASSPLRGHRRGRSSISPSADDSEDDYMGPSAPAASGHDEDDVDDGVGSLAPLGATRASVSSSSSSSSTSAGVGRDEPSGVRRALSSASDSSAGPTSALPSTPRAFESPGSRLVLGMSQGSRLSPGALGGLERLESARAEDDVDDDDMSGDGEGPRYVRDAGDDVEDEDGEQLFDWEAGDEDDDA